MESSPNARPTDESLVELLRWHIDRYDRLRASTSTRASVLLSANALLLAANIVLVNLRIQSSSRNPYGYRDLLLVGAGALTTVLILASISNCIDAIAARKTTRALHRSEIPSRFLFNWGDTLKAVDGYTAFKTSVQELNYEAIVANGMAELWTDILQHKERHKYLRRGVNLFRLTVLAFLAFAGVALALAS